MDDRIKQFTGNSVNMRYCNIQRVNIHTSHYMHSPLHLVQQTLKVSMMVHHLEVRRAVLLANQKLRDDQKVQDLVMYSLMACLKA